MLQLPGYNSCIVAHYQFLSKLRILSLQYVCKIFLAVPSISTSVVLEFGKEMQNQIPELVLLYHIVTLHAR